MKKTNTIVALILLNANLIIAQSDGIQEWQKHVKNKTCLSGDCQNGIGKMEISDNYLLHTDENKTIYEGKFKNGIPDGKGTLIYKDFEIPDKEPNDSTIVTGSFNGLVCLGSAKRYDIKSKKLIMEGNGAFLIHQPLSTTSVTFFGFATVTPIQKEWFNVILGNECKGRITYKRIGEFRGEIEDFRPVKGNFKTSDLSATYEAEKNGISGTGTIKYANGDVFIGQFGPPRFNHDSRLIGLGVKSRSFKLENGTMTYKDGRKYTGDFDRNTGKPKNPKNMVAAPKTKEDLAVEASITKDYTTAVELVQKGDAYGAFAIADRLRKDNSRDQKTMMMVAKIYSAGEDNRRACATLRFARTLDSAGAGEVIKMMRDVCGR